MTQHDDAPLQPDSVTDWAEWGRRQSSRWGKEFSGRAQGWGSDAWSWSHPREAAPQAWWSRLFWSIFNIPIAAVGGALVLALALVGATAGIVILLLVAWLAMGAISAGTAARRGWPGQLGALLGFALGPIGLLIVRRFPERR